VVLDRARKKEKRERERERERVARGRKETLQLQSSVAKKSERDGCPKVLTVWAGGGCLQLYQVFQNTREGYFVGSTIFHIVPQCELCETSFRS
jgi:hypothetical protein